MSNPANVLPPQYDDTLPRDYDPAFTADISMKMRVPDKIAVTEEEEAAIMSERQEEMRRVASMNVPDKIVVAGQEKSIGVNDPRLHLDLNLLNSMPAQSNQAYVNLQTPPRVLTLEQRPFPNISNQQPLLNMQDDEEQDDEYMQVEMQKGRHNVSFENGYIRQPVKHPSEDFEQTSLLATPGEGLLIQGDEDDDLLQLKRQVAKLHRHVQRLEVENVKRSQRELALYPVIVGYFLFQCVKWFMQNH